MTDDERKRLMKEKTHKIFQKRVSELCIEKGYTQYRLAYESL